MTVYSLTDEAGVERLQATISPAPGGGLPAEWTVGPQGQLQIATLAGAGGLPLDVNPADAGNAPLQVNALGGGTYGAVLQESVNAAGVAVDPTNGVQVAGGTGATVVQVDESSHLGFFGVAPVAKQATPILLADVVALLQAYGLCV